MPFGKGDLRPQCRLQDLAHKKLDGTTRVRIEESASDEAARARLDHGGRYLDLYSGRASF